MILKLLSSALLAALLALPCVTSSAEARSVTASQLSAAGHGRRPYVTNRPSREIYHRQGYRSHRHLRHHRRGY